MQGFRAEEQYYSPAAAWTYTFSEYSENIYRFTNLSK